MTDIPAAAAPPETPAPDPPPLRERLRAHAKLIGGAVASIAAVGAVIGGLTGYWNAWRAVKTAVYPDAQAVQKEAVAKPHIAPRLSMVVLPFANLNHDPEQDYFADGITTDLTTDLGQIPGAFVIGRGTAFSYRDKKVDLKSLGKELAVRWAVQGAVQRNGDRVRINVSLTNLATGGDVWSDRFDGDRANLVALQDQITARLARSLNVELLKAEGRRSETDRSSKPDAVDFAMRGWAQFYLPATKETTLAARELFDRALQLDPDNVSALAGKTGCLMLQLWSQWSASPAADKKVASELADRAIALRPDSGMAHVAKGQSLRFGDPEAAIPEYNLALQFDPNNPNIYAVKGTNLTVAGRAREAVGALQIALRLSPKDPLTYNWHFNLCHAYTHLHEFAEAIPECRLSIDLNPIWWYPYTDLASIYATTGKIDKAREMVATLLGLRPQFTVQGYKKLGYFVSKVPQFRREFDDIVDGLRKAGVPEQ